MNPNKIKRIVLKLGTSTVMRNNKFDYALADSLAKEISEMARQGKQFILVSSGAIGLGLEKMHFVPNNPSIEVQQAMAAIGQSHLMHNYEKAFAKYNQVIAQLLLTQQNFENLASLKNLKNTLKKLLELNIVPIINENDAVATEELSFKKQFSDNDMLAALLASHAGADLLIIVSKVGGLFSENPERNKKAELVKKVGDLSEVKAAVKGKSTQGRGGFETKLKAADIALRKGIPLIVAKWETGFLAKTFSGQIDGTLFEKKQ